jgi:alpha-L-fucosidase 2
MRELLFAGKPVEAERICREFTDRDPEGQRSYQPLGFLHLKHDLADSVSGYVRSVDYDSAVATVRFEQNGVEFRREAFVSAPDQVLVIRLSANQPGRISFTVTIDRPVSGTATVDANNRLHFSGQASDSRGGHKGANFDAFLQAVAEGGTVTTADNALRISGADSVTLLLAAATDHNFKTPDAPLPNDRAADCARQLTAAAAKTYAQLNADHVADFQRLYRRAALGISGMPKSTQSIDRRLAAAAGGADDLELLKM